MKKFIFILLTLNIVVLFVECMSKSDQYKGEVLIVDIIRGKKLMMSDFSSGINYISLGKSKDNMVASISKLVKVSDTLYFFDEKTQIIHKYTTKGDYVSRFDRIGKGPNECAVISDFVIDTIKNRIEIIDVGNPKILTVDLNWNYISKREKPGYLRNFELIAPNTYIYYASNYIDPILFKKDHSANLILTDSCNRILKTYLPIFHKNYCSAAPNQMVRNNDGVLVATPLSNKIYFANALECYVKYHINFNGYNVGKKFDYLSKIEDDDIEKLTNAFIGAIEESNKDTYATNITNMFEVGNILFFQFFLSKDKEYSKNGIYIVVRNALLGKTQVGIPENDIDYGLFGTPLAMFDDTLYTVIYPHSLKKRVSQLTKSATKNPSLIPHIEKLNSLVDKNDEDLNPIIAKVAFKQPETSQKNNKQLNTTYE